MSLEVILYWCVTIFNSCMKFYFKLSTAMTVRTVTFRSENPSRHQV
jgi:hypothetical protein